METDLFTPRIPREIQIEIRAKKERMTEKFDNFKNAEACAMDLQRLQHEMRESMKSHIGIAPEPGKFIII